MRSLHIGGEMFPALGKPRINTTMTAIALIILCVLIYPCIMLWQIIGVCLAVVISFMVTTLCIIFKISKLIALPVRKTFDVLFSPFISSICMGLVLLGLKGLYVHHLTGRLTGFLLLFITGVAVYVIFLSVFTRGAALSEIHKMISIISIGKKPTLMNNSLNQRNV